jgi:cytochrome P450
MPRKALVDMSLKDGTFIPKGTYISIGPVLMRDSSVFPEPDKFDGHRFLNLRSQPGNENKYQFVTTSPEVNVFGHGHHACPGRFFASNELKLLLAHMVMLYDFKLPEGQTKVEQSKNGMGRSPNSRQKILWRARKPEFDIIGIN